MYNNPDLWSGDEDHFMKWQDEDMTGGKSRKCRKRRKTKKCRKSKTRRH